MLKIENTEVVGWEAAIRGMRNPMNSWEKSDSGWTTDGVGNNDILIDTDYEGYYELKIGPNDQKLMARLRNAGTDHRKFMRMITVYLDITAPLYWWKEFKTYRAGRKFGDNEPDIVDEGYLEYDIEMNSCSTMHKIADKEFTLDDFSHEHLTIRQSTVVLKETVDALNVFRDVYLNGGILRHENGNMRCFGKKDKEVWWQMIQLLPSSYNQRRTVMLNYEVLANMYKSRKNHKLDEWKDFCKWIEDMPYSELITGPSTKDVECNITLPSNDMILGNATPFDLKPENFKENNE